MPGMATVFPSQVLIFKAMLRNDIRRFALAEHAANLEHVMEMVRYHFDIEEGECFNVYYVNSIGDMLGLWSAEDFADACSHAKVKSDLERDKVKSDLERELVLVVDRGKLEILSFLKYASYVRTKCSPFRNSRSRAGNGASCNRPHYRTHGAAGNRPAEQYKRSECYPRQRGKRIFPSPPASALVGRRGIILRDGARRSAQCAERRRGDGIGIGSPSFPPANRDDFHEQLGSSTTLAPCDPCGCYLRGGLRALH
ncbi:MAG: hypothetical protein BJ554DRAFT_4040 [Olpidium bornovanus]|uniref:Uncharacterized protein n=1 Tax=Olpidium bornovanus TaxID=278681 RepID=A0A8H7ZN76_9FUNG|nr:MAG: hypothetical protein BJ554DRAFT_4040 [Olpidium bornovanus]